jgi:hypothetical protein
MNPVILSFDVGVINLAYCLFTKENNKWKIIDWDIIDLTNREFTKCHCGLKASFIYNNNYYCKVHSKQCKTLDIFENIFSVCENNKCQYLIKDVCCNRKATYKVSDTINNFTESIFCKTHATSKYKILKNIYKIKPYKNKAVAGLDFDETKLKLLNKLEEKKNLLSADIVLIENQPSFKNPTMKSIAISLYDYYLIRGVLDKNVTNSNIKKVKFMSPSNKIKLADDGEIKKIVLAKSVNTSQAYKLTKELSIKYTKELLCHLSFWISFLNTQKKKDDLCDAFLQGAYYYEKNII